MRRGCESFQVHDRKSLECLEENVAGNASVKGALGKVSDGNEETGQKVVLIKQWRTWLNCILWV